MTNIYFVRHAQPNYTNHNDRERELTKKGEKDAKVVMEFLADKAIDKIFSSPFKRAVDTIRPFAETYGYKIQLCERFCERRVDSIWVEDFETFARNQWKDFTYKLSDGESLEEVQKRNIEELDVLLTQCENQNLVVGTHGTSLSMIWNYYDSSFGYEDFQRIRHFMPWIVKMSFEQKHCIQIKEFQIV